MFECQCLVGVVSAAAVATILGLLAYTFAPLIG